MNLKEISAVSDCLQKHFGQLSAKVAVVLGSGLGAFADGLKDSVELPYDKVPGLAVSTVSGHAGRFVGGYIDEKPVIAMQGRVHLYEGVSPDQVVLPTRALIQAGCQTLIVTNAAGGVSPNCGPGTLVLIRDHINLTGKTPLLGPNEDSLGTRFPDMSEAYDRALLGTAKAVGSTLGLTLSEGVYCGLTGPSYETPAEVRMLGKLGADLVGMSTVLEVIAARHMQARILGISCVTNAAAGLGEKLSHDDVKQTASQVGDQFVALIRGIVGELS